MFKASAFLLIVGVATVAGYAAVSGGGQGYAAGRGRGAIGAKIGGTGSIDTGGKLAGSANVGHGSMFGGLFQFDDLHTEGSAEGHLNAKGTASGSFGSWGEGEGASAGSFDGYGDVGI